MVMMRFYRAENGKYSFFAIEEAASGWNYIFMELQREKLRYVATEELASGWNYIFMELQREKLRFVATEELASRWNYIFMELQRVSKYFNLIPPHPHQQGDLTWGILTSYFKSKIPKSPPLKFSPCKVFDFF
jgi:hypothetical protein